jgi:23S rRNA (cytosine1962-C5)-methyltransferase
MASNSIASLLEPALALRADLFDARHESAFRLFNGFSEGDPNLVIDLYARTLVFHNYAREPQQGRPLVDEALEFIQSHSLTASWLRAAVVKTRNDKTQEENAAEFCSVSRWIGRSKKMASGIPST